MIFMRHYIFAKIVCFPMFQRMPIIGLSNALTGKLSLLK
jgi:hypothetical protein